MPVGLVDGFGVGVTVGNIDDGSGVGSLDGVIVGYGEGFNEGISLGTYVGKGVGDDVRLGCSVGENDIVGKG